MAVQYGNAGTLQVQLKGPYGGVAIRVVELFLSAQGWKGAVSPYAQVAPVDGMTLTGKVDLQPDEGQLETMRREGRAFADAMSATSATEDRSRIFHQAMKPDNAETFASETMQKKLEMLCIAIRDTWDWKKSAETYPWEQYLNESLAYQK